MKINSFLKIKPKTINMKVVIVILSFIIFPNLAFSQQKSVTLEQCRDSAKVNWPNFKKLALNQENIELITSALNKNYLPKLTLSGSAKYQSEVVVFPEIQLPGMDDFFPSFPNDNYRTDLQLQQIIYDGGNTKTAKTLQLATNELEQTQIDIDNYNLMEQINQLYLNILLLKQNQDILHTAQTEIEENIKILKSAYRNGAILISGLNKIIAEQLKIEKQILNTKSARLNLITSLKVISGLDVDISTYYQVPEKPNSTHITLPQLKLFVTQGVINQASLEMNYRDKFPKLSFFASGGYGRPGYNFMDTDLHPYGMVGVNLSWKIIDWGTYSNQKEKTVIKQSVIDINRELFIKNNKLEIDKIKTELSNLKNQIKLDSEIISIKKEIKNSSWSKFKNGTITSNEYLKDFNDFKISQQSIEINKIKYIQKEITLNHMVGVQY